MDTPSLSPTRKLFLPLSLGLLLTFSIFCFHPGHAQKTPSAHEATPASELTLVGHLGGLAGQVMNVGNYIYLAQGPEFTVLDITQPLQIHRLGYFVLAGEAESFDIVGDYAYVGWSRCEPFASCTGGLQILDLSDPTAIFEIGAIPLPNAAAEVVVAGDYAYVPWYDPDDGYFIDGGIVVLDVSNPAQPVEILNQPHYPAPQAMAIANGYGYLIDFNYLNTYDLSDPTQIFQTDILTRTGRDLQISGNYAYLTAGGLTTISLTNPAHPELANWFGQDWWTKAIDIQGNYAYVSDISPDEQYRGLHILDLTDPLSPTEVASLPLPYDVEGLAVQGNYVYASVEYMGLIVVDVSNPSAPQLVAQYLAPGEVSDVAVAGPYAYTMADYYFSASSGLWVNTLQPPANPAGLGVYAAIGSDLVAAETPYAYVGTTYYSSAQSGFVNYLRVMDVTTPTLPTQVGKYTAPGDKGVWSVAVRNQVAYITQPTRLLVVDARVPQTPTAVQTIDAQTAIKGLAVTEGYVYLSDGGLRIFDRSDPVALVEVGSLTLDDGVGYLAAWGDYVYLAGSETLHLIDVSSPSAPVEVSTLPFLPYVNDVAANGGYVFLANPLEGLSIINAVNPAQPFVTEELAYPYNAHGVEVRGGQVFLAAFRSGLYIFDYAPLIQNFFLPVIMHQP